MAINLEKIRYFLNYVLPDIIKERFYQLLDYMSGYLWWVFLLCTIISIFIILNLYKKVYNVYRERENLNKFLREISGIEKIEVFEKKLKNIISLFNVDYMAFYILKGDTYVLRTHNLDEKSKKKAKAAANMYIPKNLVKLKSSSGNYTVSTYVSENKQFLIQLFGWKFINLKQYDGFLEAIFSLYLKLLKNDEISMKVQMSTLTKEVYSLMSESVFSGTGYLSYILSIIKNAIGAKGIILYRDKEKILTLGTVENSLASKRFFIHNTGYYIDIFTMKNLSSEALKRVGSFLDMTGIFLSTFDEKNNIAKYYVEFLIYANNLFENQSKYYVNHTRKVTIVSTEIGKALFLDIEELKFLKLGASLHDIGMIADIGNLIDKSKDLNKEDLSLIKMHPLVGAILLEPVSNIYPVAPIIKYHHEKRDGTGYPYGLAGNEIPLLAQIVALAEFFVGLISDRSYKKGMPIEKAKELISQSGDRIAEKTIVDAFIESLPGIEQNFLKIKIEESRKVKKA